MKSPRKPAVVLAVVILLAGLCSFAELPDAAGQGKAKSKASAATFELYKDNGGEFRFRLVNGEGELMASSGKGYKTKTDCQKVIDAIRLDAPKAKLDDQTK